MNVAGSAPGLHRVQSWPRLSAELNDDGTGTLTINGVTRACQAESVSALRTGLIAHAVSYAVRLRRPVRLDVTEGADTYPLAVRPEGYVQLVDARGLIPPADGLTIDEGRCRHCRKLQRVTSHSCTQCGIEEPLRVEVPPHRESVAVPPTESLAVQPSAATPSAPALTERDSDEHAAAPAWRRVAATAFDLDEDFEVTRAEHPPAPVLHLAFNTQRAVTAPGRVIIGRDPRDAGGRHPVAVVSPGRQLSRTHAAIDVNDDGQILVTALDTPNGVELLTTPPRWLTPDQSTVVLAGSKLVLGDVECVVTLALNRPRFCAASMRGAALC